MAGDRNPGSIFEQDISLANKAALVQDAGEMTVGKAGEGDLAGYRDSRGPNRALRGDVEGAIEDFESVVATSNAA